MVVAGASEGQDLGPPVREAIGRFDQTNAIRPLVVNPFEAAYQRGLGSDILVFRKPRAMPVVSAPI